MFKYLAALIFGFVFWCATPAVAQNYVCGQDTNNNGYFGDEGEYTSCKAATINNSTPANQYCLQGFTMMPNGACMKYEYAPLSSQCPMGGFVQNGRCLTIDQIKPTAYCPTNYVVSGDYCVRVIWTPQNTSCPPGSFIQNGRCISQSSIQPTKSCPGYTREDGRYNGPSSCVLGMGGPCFERYGGFPKEGLIAMHDTQNYMFCVAFYAPKTICSAGQLIGGSCIINNDAGPVYTSCPTGYIPENGQCKKVEQTHQNYLCPTGTLKNGSCEVVKDMGPVQAVCPPGHIVEAGQCKKSTQSDIQYSCPKGSLSGSNCVWNTTEHYCPIGLNTSCLANNGGANCSPNKCIDIDVEKPIDDGNITGDTLVNDGKRNEEGLCLDQMFIFNGRAQDCKMPGVSNAFKDCCKSEGKALSDDAGSLMSAAQTMSTVSHVYSAATEAYTAYNAAIQAGQTAAAAMNSGIAAAQNYMMVAFDPTSLAISVAVYVVMKYLATACDQLSMETALMNDSGYCHRVGTYCKKRIKFLGCVQKAQSHCCFNSKLARIIHEQGRPQLKTGINNWGSPEAPLCRGFTPEEFQSVDFGKIDLSEYIDEIQKNATEQIQKNMSNITSDFIEQTH